MKKTIEQPKDNTHVEGFTGGEWQWKQTRGNNIYEHHVYSGQEFICRIGTEFVTTERIKANAALISQAPAMYKKLEDWQKWFCGELNELDGAKLFEETKEILLKANPNL